MNIERREFLKKAGYLAGGLTLLALGAEECESGAVTIPYGKDECQQIYWGGSDKDPTVKAHEDRHCEQIKERGSQKFWEDYVNDPCKMEREAGATDHPFCK